MVSLSVARVIHQENADKFVKAIESKKSYMNFKVLVCPAGGEWEVIVTTDYTDDEREALEFLNYIMFCAITD